MNRVAALVVAVVAVATAAGCSSAPETGFDRTDAAPTLAVPPSTAPPINEEPRSMPPQANHRATVVTNGGRIEATVVDAELEIDVSTEAGWQSAVERDGVRANVVWTSGERSIVVELRGTSSGISQQVVSTG
ncbi:MAG TPA: hypothetical protein VES40_13290 [Ilumatobacteraceae bacterium]|nr:hypothetical protein [Ilumatobacteraceae bacterium]